MAKRPQQSKVTQALDFNLKAVLGGDDTLFGKKEADKRGIPVSSTASWIKKKLGGK